VSKTSWRQRVAAGVTERLGPVVSRFDKNDLGDLVDLLVLVANADGTIDPDEAEALEAGIQSIVGARIIASLVKHLVAVSLEKTRDSSVRERAQGLGEALARVGHAEDGLRVAVTVALASEGLSQEEHSVLSWIASAGGLPNAAVDQMVEQVKAELAASATTGH
jgi:tellurite resistance protein